MIVPMVNKDLDYILRNLKENDLKEIAEVPIKGDSLSFIYDKYKRNNDLAFTQIKNNLPVAVFGIKRVAEHIGHVWLFTTNDFMIGVHEARLFISKMLKNSKFKRLYSISAEYRTESHRCMKMVGMNMEGVLHRYGKTGANFYSFVYGEL